LAANSRAAHDQIGQTKAPPESGALLLSNPVAKRWVQTEDGVRQQPNGDDGCGRRASRARAQACCGSPPGLWPLQASGSLPEQVLRLLLPLLLPLLLLHQHQAW
jgi:hypothetical protein